MLVLILGSSKLSTPGCVKTITIYPKSLVLAEYKMDLIGKNFNGQIIYKEKSLATSKVPAQFKGICDGIYEIKVEDINNFYVSKVKKNIKVRGEDLVIKVEMS